MSRREQKEETMSTLATAVTRRQWDLAAHMLIFAALQTLNDEGPVLSLSKGGNSADGKKKRRPKGQAKRLS
jgi:hypothetical protein